MGSTPRQVTKLRASPNMMLAVAQYAENSKYDFGVDVRHEEKEIM